MSIFVAIVLGVVQGLTEFLPVSSSGHLIFFEKIFGLEGNNLAFNIVVHLGTLFAVIVFYRKKLFEMIKRPFSKEVGILALSCMPTIVIYFLFKDFFDNSLSGGGLCLSFFVTAIFLTIATIVMKKYKSSKNIDLKTALVMGAFQGFAIIPGISRSGSTLTAGLVMGAEKEKVADFSFLMSIPIIVGSLVLEIIEGGFASVQILPLIVGFVTSFICGYIAIKFMLNIIRNKSFIPFIIYLCIIGLVACVIL